MHPDLLKRRERLAAALAKAKALNVNLEMTAKAEQALAKLDAIIATQRKDDSKHRNGNDA